MRTTSAVRPSGESVLLVVAPLKPQKARQIAPLFLTFPAALPRYPGHTQRAVCRSGPPRVSLRHRAKRVHPNPNHRGCPPVPPTNGCRLGGWELDGYALQQMSATCGEIRISVFVDFPYLALQPPLAADLKNEMRKNRKMSVMKIARGEWDSPTHQPRGQRVARRGTAPASARQSTR